MSKGEITTNSSFSTNNARGKVSNTALIENTKYDYITQW